DFLDFANHYQAAILPARSYKPRDKALVEKAVDITYSRVFAPLRNEVLHSLGALSRAIRTLADQHNNTAFRRRPQSRRQLFEQEEKASLTPLPVSRYEWKQSREVTVMKNGHVQIHADKHYYSVPYRFIGCKVKLIYSASEVAVWYKRERIACHRRDLKPHGYTTVKEHMPSAHRFVSEWNPDKFINWAGAIAPVVGTYIRHILDTTPYPDNLISLAVQKALIVRPLCSCSAMMETSTPAWWTCFIICTQSYRDRPGWEIWGWWGGYVIDWTFKTGWFPPSENQYNFQL